MKLARPAVFALAFGVVSDVVPRTHTSDLPDLASGVVRLEDPATKMHVRFELFGARPARGRSEHRRRTFAGALPDADLVLERRDDGVEDTVRYATRPLEEVTRYTVDVSEVAGLRLVENVLEFLDPGGAPRLRVPSPSVLDARGVERTAALSVHGCAFDTDLRGPWQRPVVAPGAPTCEVRVSWDGLGVEYPALVDPAWTSAGTLAMGHTEHAAVLLPSKRVLVISSSQPTAKSITVELFDPTTRTWSLTGPVSMQRADARAFVLDSGDVLEIGGYLNYSHSGVTATTELYNEARGTWVAGPPMARARGGMAAVRLPDGRILVAGGPGVADAELFDPKLGTWAPAGTMAIAREGPTGNLLPDGSVLVTGGHAPSGTTATAEIFTPPTTWTPTSSMLAARDHHVSANLHDGRILVMAGSSDGSWLIKAELSSAEIFDPASKTWSNAGSIGDPRRATAAVTLRDGRVLIAGGDGPGSLDTTALYDPRAGRWVSAGYLVEPQWANTVTLLDDGKALFCCGSTAAVFEPSPQAATCAADGECTTGFCVDGICCDARCDSACMACTAKKKGHGVDGVCEPMLAGLPHPDCPSLAASTCGATGLCDGAGACALQAYGTPCGGTVCQSDVQTASVCSGRGVCEQVVTACAPFACSSENVCVSQRCGGDAECAAGYFCDAQATCVPTGCDGDHVIVGQDRSRTDCAPYRCDTSGCKTSCRSTTDCAEDNVCNSEHRCIPIDQARLDAGIRGWLCAASPGAAPFGRPWGAAVALVLLVLRRRRRVRVSLDG